MKVTYPLIKRIHGLLPEAIKKDKELKGDLIQQYTGDPAKRSTKDLEIGQAKRLISDLQHPLATQGRGTPPPGGETDQRMRRKFLSMCHEMLWYHEGSTNLDWPRIGNWLHKYGHLHKRDLNAYKGKDLTTLVTQFEKVLESSYTKELKESGVSSRESGNQNKIKK